MQVRGQTAARLAKLCMTIQRQGWVEPTRGNTVDIQSLRHGGMLDVAWRPDGTSVYALRGTPRAAGLLTEPELDALYAAPTS